MVAGVEMDPVQQVHTKKPGYRNIFGGPFYEILPSGRVRKKQDSVKIVLNVLNIKIAC